MAVVIADAGPLIAFAKIGQLDILQKLFSQVMLTESVKTEILIANSAECELIRSAIKEGWLNCVEDPKLNTVFSRSLGMGEKTAIEYALQSPSDALLILDDAHWRGKKHCVISLI
jgi:predicted nucleic acid-binding protein